MTPRAWKRSDTPTPEPKGFAGHFLSGTAVPAAFSSASGPFSFHPSSLAIPRDAEDVCRLVKWAAEHGRPLVPRGAGTGMPGGNVGPGVVVDLATHLTRIDASDIEAGEVHVQAGAVAADIVDIVRPHGFTFPALPSSARWCTIGGMIANNAAGARTFGYGSVREGVVAVDMVLPDGTPLHVARSGEAMHLPALRDLPADALLSAWPRVRKNSSGYALDHYLRTGRPLDLVIGGEGTLGVITGATLRLVRQPDAQALILVRARDAAEFAALVQVATVVGASACEFFGDRFVEIAGLARDPLFGPFTRGAEALLLIEVDGKSDVVADKAAEVERIAASLGSPCRVARAPGDRQALWDVRHAASPIIARQAEHGLVSMQFIEDSVVPVARFPEYLDGVRAILRGQEMDAVIFGHAGDGNAHINPLVDVKRTDWRSRVRTVLEQTADLVAGLGGTLSGEHGDGRVRAPFLSRIWDRRIVDAFHAVKESFDPLGIMNPGVILPLKGQDPLEGMGVRFPES